MLDKIDTENKKQNVNEVSIKAYFEFLKKREGVKKVDGKYKIHISETNFTLWEVEFVLTNSYDRKKFSFEEARKDRDWRKMAERKIDEINNPAKYNVPVFHPKPDPVAAKDKTPGPGVIIIKKIAIVKANIFFDYFR